MPDAPEERGSTGLRGPQDLQEARLRDAVSRLQVLLVRDLVGQYEADERDPDLRSEHRGWLTEDVLVSRALGVYGAGAEISPSERTLVVGVLEDLRFQRFVDRLDLGAPRRHAWRLRRQNEEIIDAAMRFVDDHKWVPPVVDVARVIQTLTAISPQQQLPGLPEPRTSAELSADAHLG